MTEKEPKLRKQKLKIKMIILMQKRSILVSKKLMKLIPMSRMRKTNLKVLKLKTILKVNLAITMLSI